MKKCKIHSYLYAGLESGKTCFCSNTPPPQDALVNDYSSCSTACPGETSSMCGGTGMMNVYDTGEKSGCDSFRLNI